jgi:PilZ domain
MSGFDRYAGPERVVAVSERTRRASPRARVSWTVWATVGQERKRFHAVDVSPRGAKLRSRGIFRVGVAIELEFIRPDGRRLHVSAVVWRVDSDGLAVLFLGAVPSGFGEAGDRD